MYSLNTLRNVHQKARSFSTSIGLLAKNHYDSLGISPKATQNDVKAAYYKLSMLYHPDKNKGSDEDAQKFRDITEAYEVLGNIGLRKLYDKGVSHIGRNTTVSDTYEDPISKFYKSRERRTRAPTTGRTPIYDFDEWSRSHYGATFARDMERKKSTQFHRNMATDEKRETKMTHILFVIGVMMVITTYLSYDARNADNVYIINDSVVSVEKVPKVD